MGTNQEHYVNYFLKKKKKQQQMKAAAACFIGHNFIS